MTYAADRIAEAAAQGDTDQVKYWEAIRDLADAAPPLDEEQKVSLRRVFTSNPSKRETLATAA